MQSLADLLSPSLRLSDLAPADRPRERLCSQGADRVSDGELLALVLGTGGSGRSSLEVARDILAEAGSLTALARASPVELARIRGIGPANAARITAAFALGRRAADAAAACLGHAADIYRRYWPRFAGLSQELCLVLGVDPQNCVIGEHEVARGTLDDVDIHPRDVFRPLIRMAAAGGILVHNHPTGDPTPSSADVHITSRLRAIGDLIGVPIVDHIVVSVRGYISVAEWSMGL